MDFVFLMDPNKKTVIHDSLDLKKSSIHFQCSKNLQSIFQPEIQFSIIGNPIAVFESSCFVCSHSSDCRSLEIVYFMNGFGSWKNVFHHHKIDFPMFVWVDTIESQESSKKGVGMVENVGIILAKNFSEKTMLGMSNGFDNESIIMGIIEKRATFSRRIFRKHVFSN